mgnify:CR=1 FL=1
MQKGDQFKSTFVINTEIYEGFINSFKDRNPLHTDNDFAVKRGFNSIVMHGNILNGFLSYFVGEVLPLKNVIILDQSIKFPHPVYLNDALLFTAEIIDVFESVGMIEFKFMFKNMSDTIVSSGEINIKTI